MSTKSTNSTSTGANKISTFVLAAIYITLALSIVSIFVGITAFVEGNIEIMVYLLAIGFIAMGLSGYYLFQSRKHIANLKIENPQILTTVDCAACKEKVTREFKRGDYVYKEAEKCPKCQSLGMIVAIYREPTAKEKEKPVNV
jgi:hypothetical protein